MFLKVLIKCFIGAFEDQNYDIKENMKMIIMKGKLIHITKKYI